MTTLEALVNRGRRKTLAPNVLDAIAHDKVTDIKAQIRRTHRANGSIIQHTVLTSSLEGQEVELNSEGNTRRKSTPIKPRDATAAKQTKQTDATTQTSAVDNMADQASDPLDAIRKEFEEVKKELEEKAEKRLQEQLDRHEAEHKVKLTTAQENFQSILKHSLHAVHIAGPALNQSTTVHLPAKIAAEVIRQNSELQREYVELCTRSLQGYQADLKRQYQEHLDDIEKDCRKWLRSYSNSSAAAVDRMVRITTHISNARDFEAEIPDVGAPLNLTMTPQEMYSVNSKQLEHLWEQAQKDIEDGGISVKREVLRLEPLYNSELESNVDQRTSLVGVPAALLPLYPSAPKMTPTQGSAALGIIERNRTSSGISTPSRVASAESTQTQEKGLPRFPINHFTPISKPATRFASADARQTQEQPPQNFPTQDFTPISKQYHNSYTAQPGTSTCPPETPIVSSNTFYGPEDRLLADRTRGTFVDNNVDPSGKDSVVVLDSRNPSSGGVGTSFPLAGTFNTHQHIPTSRRIAPTLIGPTMQVSTNVGVENETPHATRPTEEISRDNILTGSRRAAPVLNNQRVSGYDTVDRSLYDADYDSEEDENYVPPPAQSQEVKIENQTLTSNRRGSGKSAHKQLNKNVDRSLYDTDYDSDEDEAYVPPDITPQEEREQRRIQSQSRSQSQVQQTTSNRQFLTPQIPTSIKPDPPPIKHHHHEASKNSPLPPNSLSIRTLSPTRPSGPFLYGTLYRSFEDGSADLPENDYSDDEDENNEDDEEDDARNPEMQSFILAQISKKNSYRERDVTDSSHDNDSNRQGGGYRRESRSDFPQFPFSRRADSEDGEKKLERKESRSDLAPFRYVGSTEDGYGSVFRTREESRSDFSPFQFSSRADVDREGENVRRGEESRSDFERFRFGGRETEDLYSPLLDYCASESGSEVGNGNSGVGGTRGQSSRIEEDGKGISNGELNGEDGDLHDGLTRITPFDPSTHVDPHAAERDERPYSGNMRRLRGMYAAKLQRKEKSYLSTYPEFKPANEAGEAAAEIDLANGNAMSEVQRALSQQKFKGKTVKEILWMLEVEGVKKKRDGEEDALVDGDGKRSRRSARLEKRLGL